MPLDQILRQAIRSATTCKYAGQLLLNHSHFSSRLNKPTNTISLSLNPNLKGKTHMTKTLKTLALTAALAFASIGAQAQQIVQDSSFSTVIGQGPWYVGGGTPVTNGTEHATLNAGASFYQSFGIVETGQYTVGFDVLSSADASIAAGEVRSRVFLSSDVGAGDFSNPVAWLGATPTATSTFAGPGRMEYTLNGVAGQSYHLYVSGFGDGVKLDNLTVTAVPEPESYAMMLAGLGALGVLSRRRKTA